VKFGTVDRRPGRRSARTDENADTAESLLLSQEDKSHSHRTVRESSRDEGIHLVISFADYSQRSASQVLQENARSTAAPHAHSIFGVYLRDDNVITSKPETCKLYSRDLNISAKYHQNRSI